MFLSAVWTSAKLLNVNINSHISHKQWSKDEQILMMDLFVTNMQLLSSPDVN